jgi:hypothetical protein
MQHLRELQQSFQNYLQKFSDAIKTEIIHTKNVDVETRLNIYRYAYYARITEVLAKDYMVTQNMMGMDDFSEYASAYINAYPSCYRSIRWMGKHFPLFLKKNKKDEALVEMAQFEWLLTESFDAANLTNLTFEDMTQIAEDQWPECIFTLHPSVRVMTCQWNTQALWDEYKNHEVIKSSEKLLLPKTWLIWRKNLEIYFTELTKEELFVLNAISQKENFSHICEGLCDFLDEDRVALEAGCILRRFVEDQLLVTYEYQ